MPTNKELLESLRDGFERLEVFDRLGLNGLRDRGQMTVRRVFGEGSSYQGRREVFWADVVMTALRDA
jgi:hypothetical protein